MDAKKRKLEADATCRRKIALGVHTGSGGLGGDVDSRTVTIDSGHGLWFQLPKTNTIRVHGLTEEGQRSRRFTDKPAARQIQCR
jgi:RNA-splicing ligase RtcB